MALKIKKSIKLPDGTVAEVEGTEAEIEAYEKKLEKKRQSENLKKEKTILNGKDREDIRKIVEEELRKQPQRVERHDHHYPVYPQQPRWDYYITQPKITWTAPNTFGTTSDKILLTTTQDGVNGFSGPVTTISQDTTQNWNGAFITGGKLEANTLSVDQIASGSISCGNYFSSVQ